MWIKYLILIVVFYFLAILQNSFLAHFGFFGAVPNLVFILFFLLVFLGSGRLSENIFYAVSAGFFLDIFSSAYLGSSITALLLIALIGKKMQTLLQERKGDRYPIIYFIPLFLAAFLIFDSVIRLTANGSNFSNFLPPVKAIIAQLIYNGVLAGVSFCLFKKFLQSNFDNRQLKLDLFKKG